nr:DUF1302 family protein [Oleomonas cavernae]
MGDERHDVWQASLRFTKIFGGSDFLTRVTGATQVLGLVEFGGIYADLNRETAYLSSGQYGFSGYYTPVVKILGIELFPAREFPDLGKPFVADYKLPTRWSGGVQGLFVFEYPDLVDGVRISPYVAFASGLFGTTPAPLPGFTKGMNAIVLGTRAEFSQSLTVSLSYFKSFGAGGGPGGSRNPLIDRDFVGATVTYQF